jgi:hypothetical protein
VTVEDLEKAIGAGVNLLEQLASSLDLSKKRVLRA